nr:50S ribosome-binding GTPase [Verrucomicrobiota bacterium]
VLREGVRTVICGAPNVGKSSLLNLLLGYERAIVNPRPGTTRDVIEEVINLRGIPLRLIDTAGVRDSDDDVERAGMERTRRQIDRADLILHVVDSSHPRDAALAAGVQLRGELATAESQSGRHRRSVLVLNKTDLGEHQSWRGAEAVRVSCLRQEGMEALSEAILQRVLGGGAAQRDWSIAINARHHACLESALKFADGARAVLAEGVSPEFMAEELRAALEAVGDIVGRADQEEILGRIFSTFCIGK